MNNVIHVRKLSETTTKQGNNIQLHKLGIILSTVGASIAKRRHACPLAKGLLLSWMQGFASFHGCHTCMPPAKGLQQFVGLCTLVTLATPLTLIYQAYSPKIQKNCMSYGPPTLTVLEGTLRRVAFCFYKIHVCTCTCT